VARFDHTLVSPSRVRLIEQLAAAWDRANQEVRVLEPLSPEQAEEIAVRLIASAEGLQQWSDSHHGNTARVAVAWWTDHLGRRHVRIRAGNSRDGSYRTLTSTRTDQRPPLWHVYPDRLFWRERGGRSGWVAVCGCGEAGPTAKLGWMGGCCAVCYDRHQEGEKLSAVNWPRSLTAPPKSPIALSPDGKTLAHVVSERAHLATVRLVDVPSGTSEDLAWRREPATALAFSPDGRLLAFTEGDDRLLVTDLENNALVLDHWGDFPISGIVFAPHGLALAAHGPAGVQVWASGVKVGAYAGRTGPWQMTHARHETISAVAWSHDGKYLAVAEGVQLLVLEHNDGTWDNIVASPRVSEWGCQDLLFVGQGHLLCLTAPAHYPDWAVREASAQNTSATLARYDLHASPPRQFCTERLPIGLSCGCFSPDGKHLAWLQVGDPAVYVRQIEVGSEVVRLGWDLDEALCNLAFSPDGQTLALLGEKGTIKLVPWRMLLGA
jgi:WD40 repeat protein